MTKYKSFSQWFQGLAKSGSLPEEFWGEVVDMHDCIGLEDEYNIDFGSAREEWAYGAYKLLKDIYEERTKKN